MADPFNEPTRATVTGGEQVTIVNGRTFAVARADGSAVEPSDGTVFEDVRILSRFTFDIEHPDHVHPRRHLRTITPTPFHAVVVSQPDPRAPAWLGEPTEHYVHRQWVGRGARHDIEIHNSGPQAITRKLTLDIGTDFAHVFDVKAGQPHGDPAFLEIRADGWLALQHPSQRELRVKVQVDPPPDEVTAAEGRISWMITAPPRGRTVVSVTFEPSWDGHPAGLLFPIGARPPTARPGFAPPSSHAVAGLTSTDGRLVTAFDQALVDLASLRIYDPRQPERVVIAAGAPWFMTLFGRDSLLSAWMALPFEPDLALGVLASLGDLQGITTDPVTEEEPGKIIHELRRHSGDTAFDSRGRYYGTVDATPLFVMLATETWRWGHLAPPQLAALWPHVVRAVAWIQQKRLASTSGFIHYHRSTDQGLLNQGWKDSGDGITFADGRIPDGPIALVEVQGYAYAALRGAALLAAQLPDPGVEPDDLLRQADDLRDRFNEAFWDPAASTYALGITGDGQLIDSMTTNPGHALWCGIAEPDLANRYLDRCADDDMFTGWGLRTLSTTAAAYNPLSYHNGSVWPHDTALVAAGAATCGRHDIVDLLVNGALDASVHFDGRPPELFAGISRDDIPEPVTYPSSCSPQAWASGSQLLNLRSMLGLEPSDRVDDQTITASRRHGADVAISGLRHGPTTHDLHLPAAGHASADG